MKKASILFVIFLFSFKCFSAGVTYLNCPTMKPLPIVGFTPAAMLPIYNVESAYTTGLNVTIAQAISQASVEVANNVASNNQQLIKQMMKIRVNSQQEYAQIERTMRNYERSYVNQVQRELNGSKGKLFPSDPAILPDTSSFVQTQGREISGASPTYKYMQRFCTAGKMLGKTTSSKQVENNARLAQKRMTYLLEDATNVSSLNASLKSKVDLHYDVFCTDNDVQAGLCESGSPMPNGDLNAFNFLYPVGAALSPSNPSKNDYMTIYTYSEGESVAAHQFVSNVVGSLYTESPTSNEINNPSQAKFVGMYHQLASAMSLSADALMFVQKNREPMNSSGVQMSRMDALNYFVIESMKPDISRVVKSVSNDGKLIEMQKKMAVITKLQELKYEQKEVLARLKAGSLALQANQE
jgi:hypothetical protein